MFEMSKRHNAVNIPAKQNYNEKNYIISRIENKDEMIPAQSSKTSQNNLIQKMSEKEEKASARLWRLRKAVECMKYKTSRRDRLKSSDMILDTHCSSVDSEAGDLHGGWVSLGPSI